MPGRNEEKLEKRIVGAAEAALAHHHYVSAIDVLTGAQILTPEHVQSWRKGRLDFLERVMQGNLNKISLAMRLFRKWATEKGLKPSETKYMHKSVELRFSKSGDPGIEKNYRTHYVSPLLSERKKEQLMEKLNRSEQPVVFEIVRDSACSECGAELPRGRYLLMEAGQPLCLPCARLDDLVFLPSGDAALTRRSAKHSQRSAVVVRFSRSRGRYERQGILVEPAALEKAEDECFEDEGARARARAHDAARRAQQDRDLTERMTLELQDLFPGCPPREAAAIAAHTATRNSGRVGRTAAGRTLDEEALTLAAIAAIRHKHTQYDELLASGVDRALARQRVAERVDEILRAWRK